ncbi:RidA family protein [Limnobacter litoralis]|uniref:RidA family protein n=1 Tax=Limnobacter litoralis TaxID=481366 RepID=A0ABQ5YN90_9BURK|nr:RidA family protein [Limnobacter litoralis]GLR24981.1 hypothetical protein GCM10007875_00680 [Limnobacter litoralis]
MSSPIERTGTTQRWSDTVTHNQTVYLCEVPEDPKADIAGQTLNVLGLLEARLKEAGSSKSRILSCTIFITDRAHIAKFNELWDAWVPEGCAPVRACVVADLLNPDWKVEIQMTAAVA